MKALTVSKFDESVVNEDAVKATREWIAVSDGAGGGGVFADKWSAYLVNHIPQEPICDYQAFDKWIDGIWEPFYNESEGLAKKEGGMLLGKFYDEGSFATLVVVWKGGNWISYGDSVAFCYDRVSGTLQHSFGRMVEFNNPPYLINCKDPTDEKGFASGNFNINDQCVVFAASDALAHYILMMYKLRHREEYYGELCEAIDAHTKDSNFISTALSIQKIDFEKNVIQKLLRCKHDFNLACHLKSIYDKGLIGHDDYSIVFM